jgi:hypothetical protein
MTAAAGLFLIAHGLVHLGVWLPSPREDAPFDPGHSWLVGDARSEARALAWTAFVVLAAGGVLVLAGAGLGAVLAVTGAAISLALVVLTFHPWLLGAAAIDAAIAIVALV